MNLQEPERDLEALAELPDGELVKEKPLYPRPKVTGYL